MNRLHTALLAALLAASLSPSAGAAEFVASTLTVPELKAVFGEVKSSNVVPARARIGGTIRSVKVSEGQEVGEGEIIAEIVDDKLALQLDAANARIEEVRSQLENTKVELDRAQQLLQRGVVSQARVDQAKTAFDVATNQLAAADSARAVVEQQAREGSVIAPATGRVLQVPVTLGSVILAGESVAQIATGQYYLRLSLPERHAAEIRQDASVLVGQRGLDAGGADVAQTTRRGRIVKVYPEIAEGRVMADVDVDGIGDYFVNERTLVWIPVGSRRTIGVPPEAVTTRHGVDYVRVLGADGPMEVAVILGSTFEQGGRTYVDVLTGLVDGDRIELPEATP